MVEKKTIKSINWFYWKYDWRKLERCSKYPPDFCDLFCVVNERDFVSSSFSLQKREADMLCFGSVVCLSVCLFVHALINGGSRDVINYRTFWTTHNHLKRAVHFKRNFRKCHYSSVFNTERKNRHLFLLRFIACLESLKALEKVARDSEAEVRYLKSVLNLTFCGSMLLIGEPFCDVQLLGGRVPSAFCQLLA